MTSAISLQTFEQSLPLFDQLVLHMPDISTVCSASDWQLCAYETLHSRREVAILQRDDCWMLGCIGALSPFQRVWQPFELAWAFGCPLIGPSLEECVDVFLDLLAKNPFDCQVVMLSGIPRHSPLQRMLQRRVGRFFSHNMFEGAHCMQSDLRDGIDAFMGARSSKFRHNLRRSARKAREDGITYEWLHTADIDAQEIIQRALHVESRSWKYDAGASIFLTERYRKFYSALIHRMAENGRLRALFVQHDGRDIAYIFGGVLGSTYRGFQLSYDESYASMSLGHLAQWEMIQRLFENDAIELYDLGMAMEYKQRWSDIQLELDNMVFFLR